MHEHCPRCGYRVGAASWCLQCGWRAEEAEPPVMRRLRWYLWATFGALALVGVLAIGASRQ